MPLPEIEDLPVKIDRTKRLRGVKRTVKAGELHAIMGPNDSAEVDILAQALLKARGFFT